MGRLKRRGALVIALALGAIVPSACADLGEYPTNVCGNAVLDEGEQCDRHVGPGEVCGAADAAAPCRYSCAIADESAEGGVRAACPPGFACGLDDICHRASGLFELATVEGNLALGSRLADFDGSGTEDVLTSGLSRLDVSYFDAEGVPSTQQSLGGGALVIPEVGHLDGADAEGGLYADAVFTKAGDVVVSLGSAAGLVPKSYAGIRLGFRPPVFFFAVPGAIAPTVDIDAALAMGSQQADLDEVGLVTLTGDSLAAVDAEWPIDGVLPWYVATGNVDPTSPYCHEVVFAYPHALVSWRPCPGGATLALENDEVKPAAPVELQLTPSPMGEASIIVGRPALISLDHDPGLELVVEVNDCADSEPDACDTFETEVFDRPLIGEDGEPLEDADGNVVMAPCCALYVGWPERQAPSKPDGPPGALTGRFTAQPGSGEPNTLGRFRDAIVEFEGEEGAADRAAIHPIAWGDFDGDGLGDFASPTAVFVSVAVNYYQLGAYNRGIPWIDAVVRDFDGDGIEDLLAAPFATPALDYLRGSAGATMGYATIQVDRPYEEIHAGDMDGDGRFDVVGRTRAADRTSDEIQVLYFADGTFSPPRTIGTFARDFSNDATEGESRISQIAVARLLTTFDSLDDLAVITTYLDAQGAERVGIALFEGKADRQLVAPIVVTEGGATVDVELATFGTFGESGVTIVADRFAIDLDEDLELIGQAEPIPALDRDALASLLPEDLEIFAALLAAGDFDDDAFDELMVAVAACNEVSCPGEAGACCESGTERSMLLLYDRVGGAFQPAAAAPQPLGLEGLAAQGFLDGGDLRLGRMRAVDVDGDGKQELLVLVGRADGGRIQTTAILVEVREGVMIPQPLPTQPAEGPGADGPPARPFGFDVGLDGSGAPVIFVATDRGVLAVPVVVASEPAPLTSRFQLGAPTQVLDGLGEPLVRGEARAVESGDVNGDGILDLVVTRPVSTEVYLGGESLAAPGVGP